MTTAVAAQRDHAGGRALPLAADAAALTGLLVLGSLLATLTWGTWGDLGSDTGYDLDAGARVAAGELPYVDFTYFYGPLAPALAGLATWLGGAGLAPGIGLGLALAAVIVGATYALARTLVGPLGAFLAAAITVPLALAPSNFSYILPHTYSATLGVLAALLFLLGLVRFVETERQSWLVAAAACAGMAALTRPEFALAVLCAAAVWLGVRRRRGEGSARDWALFAAPALLIPAAVYGGFLTVVSPRELFLDNLYPADELAAGGNHILRLHAPLTASSFVELGGRLALYAAGAAALVVLARLIARPGRVQRPLMAASLAAGILAVGAAALRPETLRYGLEFAYGWIPAGALLAAGVLVIRALRKQDGWTPGAQAALAVTVVLAVLAAKTYASFFFHAPVPQLAVYAAPFAAVVLARLHLVELAGGRRAALAAGGAWVAFLAAAGVGLTLKDAGAESARVNGPGGSVTARPAEAAILDGALDWIERETRPGEPILLAPQLTALYTLSERANPLPQISLLPGALPQAADQRDAIARLEQAGVRLAVIDRRTFPEYGHGSFGETFGGAVDTWLRQRFTHVAALRADGAGSRTLEIWLRRS